MRAHLKVPGNFNILLVALCVFCLGAKPFAQQTSKKLVAQDRVTEGFQLTAVPEAATLPSGQPIRIRLTIWNTTEMPLYLSEVGAERNYQIDIWKNTRKSVGLTEHGKTVINAENAFDMNASIEFRPGQERTDVIQISDLYDMNAPGTYTIVLSRRVTKQVNIASVSTTPKAVLVTGTNVDRVTSNIVLVTVR